MSRKHDLEEIRGKDTRELLYDLAEARKDMFNARLHISESMRPSSIGILRRRIARIMTILRQREITEAAQAEGGE
ncbi:MAG: 50S ribosomal protein L29 [Planctomycetota bacterium]